MKLETRNAKGAARGLLLLASVVLLATAGPVYSAAGAERIQLACQSPYCGG